MEMKQDRIDPPRVPNVLGMSGYGCRANVPKAIADAVRHTPTPTQLCSFTNAMNAKNQAANPVTTVQMTPMFRIEFSGGTASSYRLSAKVPQLP